MEKLVGRQIEVQAIGEDGGYTVDLFGEDGG